MNQYHHHSPSDHHNALEDEISFESRVSQVSCGCGGSCHEDDNGMICSFRHDDQTRLHLRPTFECWSCVHKHKQEDEENGDEDILHPLVRQPLTRMSIASDCITRSSLQIPYPMEGRIVSSFKEG